MTFPYAPLLQPLQIGKLTIKNRFCVGPLTLPSLHGPFGEFSENGLAYFEERAKGGFGLIFTGAFHPDTLVDPVHPLDSKQPLKAPKSFQRSAVELLERLDAYGAKMMPQVSMGYGRNALGCFCPSEIPYYHDPARIAPALTKDQIKQKIDQMIATAVLLKQCGFPGIEVHAMHWGYLLDQFAMTFMNHRTDEYGGALENRLRCAREILDGVKAACGSDFVVSMRLALKSYIKGYNHPSLHGEDEVGAARHAAIAVVEGDGVEEPQVAQHAEEREEGERDEARAAAAAVDGRAVEEQPVDGEPAEAVSKLRAFMGTSEDQAAGLGGDGLLEIVDARAEVRDDLEVVFGDELGDLAVALDDEGERGRLDAPEREDALVAGAAGADGLRARGVDADEPICALARVRRIAEALVLFVGLQVAEAFDLH